MGNNASKSPGEASASPGAGVGVNHVPSRSATQNSKSPSSRHKASHNTQNERKQATQHPPSLAQPAPHSRQANADSNMGSEHSKPTGPHDEGGASRLRAALEGQSPRRFIGRGEGKRCMLQGPSRIGIESTGWTRSKPFPSVHRTCPVQLESSILWRMENHACFRWLAHAYT